MSYRNFRMEPLWLSFDALFEREEGMEFDWEVSIYFFDGLPRPASRCGRVATDGMGAPSCVVIC